MHPPLLTQSTPPVGQVESPTDRLVRMLNDPSEEPVTLTRAQLAWLMGTAQRWGWEARELAENEEWAAEQGRPPVVVGGRWIKQTDYRRECDRLARLPRENDFMGGLPLPQSYTGEVASA